jgi:hypothetical protein
MTPGADIIPNPNRGFFSAVVGDGRPLLILTALILILSGGFALFQSCTGQFLPQDVEYLQMTARDLCRLDQCRIVHFMFHDRVSFGGTLIAVGSLYLWLAEFPLRQGQAWAWWLFMLSGLTGFGSFLAYLSYGYLDSWHGVATLFLLPCFVAGLWRSHSLLIQPAPLRSLLHPSVRPRWASLHGVGRLCLLATALALIGGGTTILIVGSTSVFVPTDLQFMGLSAAQLRAVNPHLVPLIAHDRAGFGGGLCSTGVLVFFCVWCGSPSRSLWQALCVAGVAGFALAIGIHPIIGYDNLSHVGPAVLVALVFLLGIILCYNPMLRQTALTPEAQPT